MNHIEVKNNEDGAKHSLRWAIDQAHALPHGMIPVITLGKCLSELICLKFGELVIKRDLIIVNERGHLTISANGQGRIFRISDMVRNTKITSKAGILVLSDGRVSDNGGAIMVEGSNHQLSMAGCQVTKCVANQFGGAIYSMGMVVLKKTKVDCNEAGSQGGGLWVNNGVYLTYSCIDNNFISIIDPSSSGGGIYSNIGNIVIDNTTVNNNQIAMDQNRTMGGFGGGITNMNGPTTIQNNSSVSYNQAFNAPGLNQGVGDANVINHSCVNYNQSFNNGRGKDSGGGGIVIALGTTYISDSEIVGNKALGMYCAGVVSLFGDVITLRSNISNNSNNGPGGAVALNIGTGSFSDSTFNNNTAAALGGAIVSFTPSPGYVAITNSTISGNVVTNGETIQQTIAAFVGVIVDFLGGMVLQANANPQVTPNPFNANALKIIQQTRDIQFPDLPFPATLAGGAVASLTTAPVTIINSKVVGNKVGQIVTQENVPFRSFGGGVFGFLAPLTIVKSQVNENRSTTEGGGLWIGISGNVTDSTVSDNKAGSRDSNIFNNDNSQSVLIRTSIDKSTITNQGRMVVIK